MVTLFNVRANVYVVFVFWEGHFFDRRRGQVYVIVLKRIIGKGCEFVDASRPNIVAIN